MHVALAAEALDDPARGAQAVRRAVAPGGRGRIVGVTRLVEGARHGGDPRVAPRLHLGPCAHLGRAVGRGLHLGNLGVQVLALVHVLHEREEQGRALGEVEVQGLPRDARRTRKRGHRWHLVGRCLDQVQGVAEDPLPRT